VATLQDAAARVGAHRWMELALWRLLGGWAIATDDAAPAAVRFDIDAQHAAWRAEQWWDRLPVLAGIEREDLVRPASAGIAAVVDHLSGPSAPASTVGRAAAAYRVILPRLVVGYGQDRALLLPASDGPVVRTLGQVVADAAADWQAGEALVQSLLVDAAAVEDASTTVSSLELLASGPAQSGSRSFSAGAPSGRSGAVTGGS
jgi:hypothetical protein